MCQGNFLVFWCPCWSEVHLATFNPHPGALGHSIVRTVDGGAYMWCKNYMRSPVFDPGRTYPPLCPDRITYDTMDFRSTTLCHECIAHGCQVEWTPRSMYGYLSKEERRAAKKADKAKRRKENMDRRESTTSLELSRPPTPALRRVDTEKILRDWSDTPLHVGIKGCPPRCTWQDRFNWYWQHMKDKIKEKASHSRRSSTSSCGPDPEFTRVGMTGTNEQDNQQTNADKIMELWAAVTSRTAATETDEEDVATIKRIQELAAADLEEAKLELAAIRERVFDRGDASRPATPALSICSDGSTDSADSFSSESSGASTIKYGRSRHVSFVLPVKED